jgi:hypothetical protein
MAAFIDPADASQPVGRACDDAARAIAAHCDDLAALRTSDLRNSDVTAVHMFGAIAQMRGDWALQFEAAHAAGAPIDASAFAIDATLVASLKAAMTRYDEVYARVADTCAAKLVASDLLRPFPAKLAAPPRVEERKRRHETLCRQLSAWVGKRTFGTAIMYSSVEFSEFNFHAKCVQRAVMRLLELYRGGSEEDARIRAIVGDDASPFENFVLLDSKKFPLRAPHLAPLGVAFEAMSAAWQALMHGIADAFEKSVHLSAKRRRVL